MSRAPEQVLRDALHAGPCVTVEEVLERLGVDAVARVQAQMKVAAAPGESGTTAEATDCEGVDAMGSIQHHEEVTVYGTACVLHTLAGRPEYRGVNDSPNGPFVTIQDGDMVLRCDDVATLNRWAEQCRVAAAQLARHQERLAAHDVKRDAK